MPAGRDEISNKIIKTVTSHSKDVVHSRINVGGGGLRVTICKYRFGRRKAIISGKVVKNKFEM